MSAAQPLDPHDQMRSRDVGKVARGEQAPRPAHEYGTVSKPPPPSSSSVSSAQTNVDDNDDRRRGGEDKEHKKEEEHVPECGKFTQYYRSGLRKGTRQRES